MVGQVKNSNIKLKRIFFESRLPEELAPLHSLANNLWWSWRQEAIELFKKVAGSDWVKFNYNPVKVLEQVSREKAQALIADADFMNSLQSVDQAFKAYLAEPANADRASVAYFSMEYGLHYSVRLYSGGLGVLAGDFLKEASDSNVRMTAVGLLYRYGYFQQGLSLHGDQINNYPSQKFTELPLQPVRDENGEWVKISVDYPGRTIFAKIWRLDVGRIPLYLMDTDIDENSREDRAITHHLYGGDNEHRLKQEMLLGIGGIRALKALGVNKDIYHCNEGHAAFLGLERLLHYRRDADLSFEEAIEVVRSSSLFTTHTPVPAGHDYFSEDLLRHYFTDYINQLGISWEQFITLGKVNFSNRNELFSMSHLAIRLSQEVNGVSKLHGAVSKNMFRVLYPGYTSEENHIGYVTNSVHYPTWIANEWHKLYCKYFGEEFLYDQSNADYWRKIHNVPAEEIMAIRQSLKSRLLTYVKEKMREDLTRRGENPSVIFNILNNIKNDALVFGFARRFATYKRAYLLFSNVERLKKILNQTERPIIFLFAGKAHPADHGGQDLIRNIIQISKQSEFAGKVIFLENYNMEMAKLLVQGVDVWLNTPTRPKEASGTSGMKAALNGVVNFSVLDGWWAEGYRPDAGWALPLERTYQDQNLQNQLDAETIYNVVETEIVPTYFDYNEAKISEKWVSYVRNIIAEVAPQFTMKRMLDDYYEHFYSKLANRNRKVIHSNYNLASKLAAWKAEIWNKWDNIELVDMQAYDTDNYSLPLGRPFNAKIKLNLDGLSAKHLGIELVFFKRENETSLKIGKIVPLELTAEDGYIATYECHIDPQLAGVHEYGFRLFPKLESLPNRQDFNLVRWL